MEKKITLVPGTKISIETNKEGTVITIYKPGEKKEEFKNGDILRSMVDYEEIVIFQEYSTDHEGFKAYCNNMDMNNTSFISKNFRMATKEEVKWIFAFLKDKGLQWNSLKKCVEKWMPKSKERYYYISSDGKIVETYNYNDSIDEFRLNAGNCYPTKEIAENHKIKVMEAYK